MRSSFPLLASLLSAAVLAEAAVHKTKVVILGAGLTGVTAAKALALERNITDFIIVEALPEVGGRLKPASIGGYPIEIGANWVQGLGTNPIWALAQKYNVTNVYSDWENIDYFDGRGYDFDGKLEEAFARYEEHALVNATKISDLRQERGQADLNFRAGLNLAGWVAQTPYEKTAEYFEFDWEYAEPPVQSSFIQNINSFIYNFDGFGNDSNNFVFDKRGFRMIAQGQADEIPNFAEKILYNETVTTIAYSKDGVIVTTADNTTIEAEFALCTFSIGVLQNTDVTFDPELPDWKKDAIANFHMATYMKIFMQFPSKFWNDTEFSVYADPDERGYYAVWQSLDVAKFYPGSHLFMVTLTSAQAYQAELQTEQEVVDACMTVLRTMYGSGIPSPIEIVIPRWTLDPLFRGTFTNWGAGATVEQQNAIRAPLPDPDMPSPESQRLFFAGEGTSRKYFGYLQGAYFEGRLASAVIADCVENGCLTSEKTAYSKREILGEREEAEKRTYVGGGLRGRRFA
ncbi:amine oxidase [Mytilinidion resinicola]|uniref:Amine oxidase n=1 Tax=Mytilinidion resinicola TaxID=574789 RepID=A0A6A6YCA1_9PEZI|nr:amine oxidase [Mytilinidion resinicola]KAF2806432.1 amine oxidase [Mytilinidion resinicola]